jgi:ribosomal biogenesis protein LAS1
LTWLLNNYWLPTLSPSNTDAKSPPEIPPLAPLLKDYRALLKLTTRDASLKSRHKGDILKLHRDLERWIGEIKVAYGLDMGQMDDDEKERWAIDQLCDEILEKGFLVPVSKK